VAHAYSCKIYWEKRRTRTRTRTDGQKTTNMKHNETHSHTARYRAIKFTNNILSLLNTPLLLLWLKTLECCWCVTILFSSALMHNALDSKAYHYMQPEGLYTVSIRLAVRRKNALLNLVLSITSLLSNHSPFCLPYSHKNVNTIPPKRLSYTQVLVIISSMQ